MKRKLQFLTKTLLVAAGLLMGVSSAWADNVSFANQQKMSNSEGTWTAGNNAGNNYALALADLSGITGITSENKAIVIEFDSNVPSNSRWWIGIGDKATRGTNAHGSDKATYNTEGIIAYFGTGNGTTYPVNGSGNYGGLGVSVHSKLTLNKRTGKYSLVITNKSTDEVLYSATDISTTITDATIVEVYTWLNNATVTLSDVTVTVKDTYSYTINAINSSSKVLKTLGTGAVIEGESVSDYYYPQNVLVDNVLYTIAQAATNPRYATTFTPNANNFVKNLSYTSATVEDVVAYIEVEEITGTSASSINYGQYASKGLTGRTTNSETYVDVMTLPVGKYQIFSRGVNPNSSDRTCNFKVGDDVKWTFTISKKSSLGITGNSEEFTVSTASTLSLACDGSSQSGCDWFYIKNVSNNEIIGNIDFSAEANTANSQNYTMRDGETMKFTFTNHGTTFGNNWRISVKEGETWKANVGADSYDYTANAATKTSYTMSTDGGSSKIDLVWDRYAEDMADAEVEATLTYSDGTLSMVTTSTGTANGYIYYVDQDVTSLTSNLTINISVNHSWIENLVAKEDVTVSAAGYATYVSANNLDFTSTSIKAYEAKVNAGKVVLTPINKVQAGTGVVLYKEGGATESIPVCTDYDTADDNELVAGTGAAVETTDGSYTNYILNNVSGIGFYKANGQTVASNRAYLHTLTANISGGAPLYMFFNDSETTGINAVKGAEFKVNGEYYNLAGQRVAQPTKGLYIVNGRKVVIK